MFFIISYFFFFLFFNLMFLFLNFSANFGFSVIYFFVFLDSFNNFDIAYLFNLISFTFIFMVSLVMVAVSLYSSYYLDYYNNKKFFFLMISFFFTMLILCIGGSPLMLMLGWDGLGVTSILLVMFYPSSNSKYNSFLTMTFNRLGDVFMLILISYFFLNTSFMHMHVFDSLLFFFLLTLCCFTKSAQFPFSSWLPAAMSAPTPISAMVHSSTLITAGIFLCLLFFDVLSFFGCLNYFLFFSVLTFFMGGFGANFEFDFKKLVAFSTMSQISMIIFFISSYSLLLGMCHMVLHAFFKTLIFVCAGSFFVSFLSNQFKNVFSLPDQGFLKFFIFFGVFCMSGLYFSSSFFTKDLVMEWFNGAYFFFFWIFLILGSVLTLSYSCKMFCSIYVWANVFNVYVNKFYNLFSFFIIFLFILFVETYMIFVLDLIPLCSFFDSIFFSFIFFFFFFFSMPSTSIFFYYSKNVFYNKSFFYGYLHFFFSSFWKLVPNDHFFFKPYVFAPSFSNYFSPSFHSFNFNSVSLPFFLLFLFILSFI